jgi:tripartite-type tricarboxylate transporter receptor subunit TctC
MKRSIAVGGLVAAMGAAAFKPALAQSYPSKPIQLVVSTAPGAGTDLMARTLSDRLGARLGTVLVVENRAGASGLVAPPRTATHSCSRTTPCCT